MSKKTKEYWDSKENWEYWDRKWAAGLTYELMLDHKWIPKSQEEFNGIADLFYTYVRGEAKDG